MRPCLVKQPAPLLGPDVLKTLLDTHFGACIDRRPLGVRSNKLMFDTAYVWDPLVFEATKEPHVGAGGISQKKGAFQGCRARGAGGGGGGGYCSDSIPNCAIMRQNGHKNAARCHKHRDFFFQNLLPTVTG